MLTFYQSKFMGVDYFFIILLIICIILYFRKAWFSKDSSLIWSPMTFLSLVYIYYCIIPFFHGNLDIYNVSIQDATSIMNAGALISYLCIWLGFSFNTRKQFYHWNSLIDKKNAKRFGIILFILGLICYIPFRGFHISFFNVDEDIIYDREGFTSYFIDLISLFCGACSLLFVGKRKKIDLVFLGAIWLTLVFFIIAGFRFRIVILMITLFTTYHLYPFSKKLNYPILIIVAVVAYLGFGIMDYARSYGHGINLENVDFSNERKGANESDYIYVMSALSMKQYDAADKLYFEPLITAICMPIPRALAPWKPDGKYLKDIQLKVLGTTDYGAAFVFFVEAFISWGWLGVVLYSIFVGWISKIFWSNYRRNPRSIGAIVLLGLFNGFSYVLFSRGYMAQVFNTFIYFVILPFWIIQMSCKVWPKRA